MENHFKIKFQADEYDAEYVTDINRAILVLDRLYESDFCAVDTETKALSAYKSNPQAALSPHLAEIALSQFFDGQRAFVFNHSRLGERFKPLLVRFLESGKFVAHYALFDLQFFMKLGVRTMDLACTQIITKLLYHAIYASDEGLSAKLDDVCEALFQEKILKKLQASNWGDELTFEQIQYAALDAVATYKIAEKLALRLQTFGLDKIYKLTKEAQFPIAWMQLNGIRLNVPRHKLLTQKWREELYESRLKLVALTGMDTFTGHTLSDWLSKNLPLDVLDLWPRTDTGKLATDAHVFADFSYLPIVDPFSKFQKALKLTTTYGKPLVNLINPETGRLHAHYNLSGARTGRLSCSKPNLQQSPKDKEFRSCFIPETGNVFVRADFNQIEVRIAAEVSQDATMLKAYREGVDIHRLTASQVSKKPLDQVTDSERQLGKAIVFGLAFGMGAKKFVHYAKKGYGKEITEDEAYDAVEAFRTTYSGYREWQLKQTTECAQTMTVRTPMGKLRRLNTDNCYGASLNTGIQGGAAECMLYALIFLYHSFLNAPELGAKLVNCVHDEVVIECPLIHKTRVSQIVEESMVNGFLQVFPKGITKELVAVSSGANWSEAK